MVLIPGDPAPWFSALSTHHPTHDECFRLHPLGGQRVVLSFLGSLARPASVRVLRDWAATADRWAQLDVQVVAASLDPSDRAESRPQAIAPELTTIWDFDRAIADRYGVCRRLWADPQAPLEVIPQTAVLDCGLRFLRSFPLGEPTRHVAEVLDYLAALPPLDRLRSPAAQAPILRVPGVLDPETCAWAIAAYRERGGTPSGFMRTRAGQTVAAMDRSFKRRSDWVVRDRASWNRLHEPITRRLFPAIERAFHFPVRQVERYLVACYDGDTGGYFKAHRDNTTPATRHRKFALTLNLNADFEGGALRFPEYERHGYRPEPGEALVFSGSLLHEAMPVARGQRYALLSFFY